MDDFLKGLQQPEYLHAVLNHWPIYGLLAGLATLFLAQIQKSRPAALGAYVVIFLSAASIFPVSQFGEKAEDRMDGLIDEVGRDWMHEHKERAEGLSFLYYMTALLAVAGLTLPGKFPKTGTPILVCTLLLGLGAFGAGVWIAQAGGKIHHQEFRYSPVPGMENP